MTNDEGTWSDEQDAQYTKRVAELYDQGKPEFAIESIAATEVNTGEEVDTAALDARFDDPDADV